MNHRRSALALLAALLATTVSVVPAAAATPTATAVASALPAGAPLASTVLAGPADDLLRRTNAERTSRGLPALQVDTSLTRVAQVWSQHMAATGRMAHNPYYTVQIPGGWRSAAENVAWNKPASAAGIHTAWMNSAGHRANILSAKPTHIGIGWYVDAAGRGWATQVFAGYPAGTVLPRFWDVPTGHPFHRDVEWAATSRVANGYDGGAFRGEAPVSREAMAAFLYRSVRGGAEPTCSGAARDFRDVPSSSPFCGVIEWMADAKITTGYADGTFRPGATVTRESTAAFLHRALGGTSGTCSTAPFADVRAASPFCTSIRWMANQGIAQGYAGNRFAPAVPVSRQAMAAFLHRAE